MKVFLPFDILHEDRDVIVIDKPAGLLTTHTKLVGRAARESQPTAENFLNDYLRKGQLRSSLRVWLIHRLDRDTSGVMMFAKRAEVAEWYREHWSQVAAKTYIAKVQGRLDADSGVFESYLLEDAKTMRVHSVRNSKVGKFARTEWRLVGFGNGISDVEIVLKSGRKNQIRVHFSEAGHPILGDVKYGGRKSDRMYLHSAKLRFQRRNSTEWLEFTA